MRIPCVLVARIVSSSQVNFFGYSHWSFNIIFLIVAFSSFTGCELKADKDYHFKVDNDENEHQLSLRTVLKLFI